MAEARRHVAIFTSLDDENRAERDRRKRASTEERLAEFAALLARVRGPGWTAHKIERSASVEPVAWESA